MFLSRWQWTIAMYRLHAQNPTQRPVTVSVLLTWTNMVGWFRTFTRDFRGAPNQGNHNRFASEALGSGAMKGIVFERNRAGATLTEADGQFVIAALETLGVEVTYQTSYAAQGDGRPGWNHFSKDGRLANSDLSWVSDGEQLAGAVAVRFTLLPGATKIVPMVIFLGLPCCGVWRGPPLESPLYGFLWDRRK
jgi:non-lysosomal glucosylceramidase